MKTEQNVPQTLGDIIERNAIRYGDRIALFNETQSLGYSAYRDRCTRIAGALHRRGVLQQDRVAFLMMNSIELICMYGAAELAGYIAVPLNWRLSAAEVLRTVADCKPKVLVFDARFAEVAEAIAKASDGPTILISATDAFPFAENLEEAIAGNVQSIPKARPTDIAYIIYTSGSSGQPKGVMLDQRGQLASIRISAIEMRLSADDRALITMPLFHVGAKLYQAASNMCGAPAYMAERFDAGQVLDIISRHKITVMPMVPTMMGSLVNHADAEKADLSSIRLWLYTGAAMPGNVIRKGLDLLGPRFLQMYGQTEILGGTILHPHHHVIGPDGNDRLLSTVGQPGMLAAARTVDETGATTPTGVPGEVLLQSEAIMRGYWNNSVATAETIADGWIRTGDIGVFDDEGFLSIVGRRKDMIITGGENVFAGEVEEALVKHPAVAEAAVVGVPDPQWGETVKALVMLHPGASVTKDELVGHCAALIASYKKPKYIQFVKELPKNPVGKIDKKLIKSIYATASDHEVKS